MASMSCYQSIRETGGQGGSGQNMVFGLLRLRMFQDMGSKRRYKPRYVCMYCI